VVVLINPNAAPLIANVNVAKSAVAETIANVAIPAVV